MKSAAPSEAQQEDGSPAGGWRQRLRCGARCGAHIVVVVLVQEPA